MAGLSKQYPFYSRFSDGELYEWHKENPVACMTWIEEEMAKFETAQAGLKPGEPNPCAYEGGEDSPKYRSDYQIFHMADRLQSPPAPTPRQIHAQRFFSEAMTNSKLREINARIETYQREQGKAIQRGDFKTASLYAKRIELEAKDITPDMFQSIDQSLGERDAREYLKATLERLANSSPKELKELSPKWREDLADLAERVNAMNPDAEESYIVDRSGNLEVIHHAGRTVAELQYCVKSQNQEHGSAHDGYKAQLTRIGAMWPEADDGTILEHFREELASAQEQGDQSRADTYKRRIEAIERGSINDPTLKSTRKEDDGFWEGEGPTGEQPASFSESVSYDPSGRDRNSSVDGETRSNFSESVSQK